LTGRFITSVDADNIRHQHEEQLAAEELKQQRSQLQSGRLLLIQEVNKLQSQWRAEKKSRIDQGQERLTWKQWLSETGKDLEFISLETSKRRYNELLNQKADGFMIDTQPDPSFAAEVRAACRTARPILAMRIPNSDDTVTFTSFGPFHDQDDDPHEEEEDDEGIVTQETPRWMRSSPPLGSDDALEETIFETPCPSQPPPAALAPQPPRQLWKQIEKELKEFRIKRARKEQSGDHDTMRNPQ
ncbi:hypothetical protein BGZ61DRAFT_566900, partial [Ilyonectria robusta]|uniref:uncharacterized protein n=1 Tax=Ilyonectria robusta TaxID=1079257 RepID=UPI001E8EE0CA